MDKDLIKANIEGNGNIVIQGISDSTITLDPGNYAEVRTFLINFQDQISSLPIAVLNMLKTEDHPFGEEIKGIKINLSLGAVIPELRPERRTATFKVYITNLEKIHRYCQVPYFKVSKPVIFSKGTPPHDTFVLFQNEHSKTIFPRRLEFGEQVISDFDIVHGQFEFYNQLDDQESYIQAFVATTLGELYSSNQYLISKFIKEYKAFMAPW